MERTILAMVLMAAGIAGAAVNGVVKDDKGNPVSGALVVAEGTHQSAITDGKGKFELAPFNAGVKALVRNKTVSSFIRVDAQGKFQRESGALAHKQYFFRIVDAKTGSSGTGSHGYARRLNAPNANLLISHDGLFGEVAAVDARSSAPLELSMGLISEFSKSNQVASHVGDVKVLQFTDSLIVAVDSSSKEYPVCKGGVVTFLPDTGSLAYKIVGKTMYQWDPEDVDDGDLISTLLTSASGEKFGTWNLSGLGQVPMPLSAGSPSQPELDSMLLEQRSYLKVSGTSTLGNAFIHNDVEFGFCMGPLMASAMASGPLTATSKSCTEVELKNGAETATWTFVTHGKKTSNTFTYKDSSCVTEGEVSDGPVFNCVGKADGHVPVDTSAGEEDTGMDGLANCPAFVKFLTGGIGLPGGFLPPGGVPLMKKSLERVPNPVSLERKTRAKLLRRLF